MGLINRKQVKELPTKIGIFVDILQGYKSFER